MSDYPRYHIRQLLGQSEAFFESLPVIHAIEFDDGQVVNCYQRETQYSSWFWPIFSDYQNTQVLYRHHVRHTLNGKALGEDTPNKLCTAILRDVVKTYNLIYPIQKEPILAKIYQLFSAAQRNLIMNTLDTPISIDILDFIQVSKHPVTEAYRKEAINDPSKIKYGYEGISKLMRTNPEFDDNGLVKAVRAGMVRENQVLQCVGYRGFATEVDGAIYQKPIWSNYVTGNRKLADFAQDSRTAAKSHFYSDSSLQDSEYRARIFQLYGSVLERIVYEDCGSTRLKPWLVKGKSFDASGAEVYGGDIPLLIGKNYYLSLDDPMMTIDGTEDHLVGKTIWLRTALGCQHKDVHAVCHVCAGELHHNFSRFDNIGHVGIVTSTGQFTQNILSIKHVNMSSVVIRLLLGDFEKRYMHTGQNGDGFYLKKPNEVKMGSKLMVSVIRDEAPGLGDLLDMNIDSQISLNRISQTNHIRLEYVKEGDAQVDVTVNVKVRKTSSMLSRHALEYIHKVGWTVDENNNFVFDMSDWDYSKPLLTLQSKEVSFVDLANEVKSMIQSNQKTFKKRVMDNAPFVLLQELFDLVNSKLKINIFSFEAIIYGLIISSKDDISMGRHSPNQTLGIADNLVLYRSLGAALDFEAHEKALFNPQYHTKGRRPDSVMDVFLNPREVVEAKGKKGPHAQLEDI